MASDSSELMQLQQSLKSKSLELAYEQNVRQIDAIYEEERLRQLRLRVLLMEDQNNDLHDELAQDDDRIDELERIAEDGRGRLEEANAVLQKVQNDLRARTRELETVKAELQSLSSISTDSTRVLTEKLALSRELSNLKPELEHLRSQAASHQTLLSEKLSLQRQLSTVQVDLETEKRAAQRATAKEVKTNQQDAKLESQLEDLRKALSKERREREKIEREAKDGSNGWQGEKEVFEDKIEAFRTKLRTTKDQLKETQAELQKAHVKVTNATLRTSSSGVAEKPSKSSRKRTAAQLDQDAAIGTPGAALPAMTKGRQKPTLAGEKSTFSITPFLNRTIIAPDSASKAQETNANENHVEEEFTPVKETGMPQHTEVKAKSPTVPKAKTVRNIAKKERPTEDGGVLIDASIGKGNVNLKDKAPRKRTAAPTLENVAEEDDDENTAPAVKVIPASAAVTKFAVKPVTLFATVSEEVEPKKKKRKLLGGGPGKTLFDEDEGELIKPAGKSLFGGGKAFSTLSKGGLAGAKGGLRGGLGGAVSGFGDFSPLKKHKKSGEVSVLQ
ncbi:MAG: hypothetical protein M1827_004620 [Pycnora praestabilis]|nr:MAG: hypothetical protein M1827_004620 [Pycnora praestabilis]